MTTIELILRDYLIRERSCVVWNKVCLVSDILNEMREKQLPLIDVNALLDKLVQEGVVVQINYNTTLLGPTCAYLISGHVTSIIDNTKA